MAGPGNDPFEALDDSLLCKILESLLNVYWADTQIARIRFSAVCKRFKEVEHQLRSLTWYFDYEHTEEPFLRWVINNHVSGLRKLCLDFNELHPDDHGLHRSLNPILLAALLPSLKTMREIHIELPYSGDVKEEQFSILYPLARACPLLEKFTISGDTPLLFDATSTTVFPALRCLGSDVTFAPEHPVLDSVFPALKELHLMQLHLGLEGPTTFEVSSTTLTYFNCDISSSSQEPRFLRIHGSNLVSIDMRYSDGSSIEVQIRCPKLQMLSLRCYERDTEETFSITFLEKLEAPLQALLVDNVPYTCLEQLLFFTQVDRIRACLEGEKYKDVLARKDWPTDEEIQKHGTKVSFHSTDEMSEFCRLLREIAIQD